MNGLKKSFRLVAAIALAILLSGFVGVGSVTAARKGEPERAHATVGVVVVPRAAPAGADANTLVYDLIATNRGDDWAKNVAVTLPFNPTALKMSGVTFSGEPAWLMQQNADSLVIGIERLNGGAASTASVRFAKLPTGKGAGLTERATYIWSEGGRSGSGSSNMPLELKAYYPLTVSTFSTESGVTQRFAADIFAPGEPVTFWCNMPDGTIHALMVGGKGPTAVLVHTVNNKDRETHRYNEYMLADPIGAMFADLGNSDLTPGAYSIVAYGNWTGLQAVGSFQVK